MSDTWVPLVPKDKEYIPSAEAQVEAIAYFRQTITDSDDVKAEIYNTLVFFDAGSNDCACCPNCVEVVEQDFWITWLEADEDNGDKGFKFEAKTLPFCDHFCTLRDLKYDFDQGFARFSLEALVMNVLSIK